MRSRIFLVFSILVAAAVVSYLLSSISLGEVKDLIVNSNKRAVLIFVVLSIAMSVFRTWRYKLLLALNGYRPTSISLFLVVLVRNFFSDLLPARAGTLIYIFILNTRLGVPLDAATSSFALAFLFDIIAIVPLVVLAALSAGPIEGIPQFTIIEAALLLAVITAVLIYVLPRAFHFSAILTKKLPFLPAHWSRAIAEFLDKVESDIRAVRDAGMYGRVLVLSVFVRLGKYGSLYAFLYALLQPLGYKLADLPAAKVFIGLCIPELAASMPFSGIAGIGAYQGAWVFIFNLLGFPLKIAQLTSVSHHLFTQLYGYLVGILALLILLLPAFRNEVKLEQSELKNDSLGKFSARVVLVCAFFSVLIYSLIRL
ncbi:MAG: flippase-like domain-containing protein [Deltaproteobacteria bacterium]|nr:flippase-like domain-containing protein [Deltaproteobacteria bacterium]